MVNYLWCVVGIVISVLLPIGWEAVRRYFPTSQPKGMDTVLPSIWAVVKPYAILGLVSALTAILLLAFVGDAIVDWRAALLAGYAWDSTLQKLAK